MSCHRIATDGSTPSPSWRSASRRPSALFEPDSDDEARREALETARTRWDQADLRAYSFTFHKSCDCLYTAPVRITVVEGEIDDLSAIEP